MPALAILAGGLATRLGELTKTTPKSLIEVAGQPFIVHQLRAIARLGIEDVVLCLGHYGEKIEAVIGDGSALGLRVQYSYDGPVLLGTGGALKQALPRLSDPFFVLYGDSYLDLPLQPVLDAWKAAPADALMTVYRNEGLYDRSNVRFENGQILVYEKNSPDPAVKHIDWGLGLIDKKAFAAAPEAAFDLAAWYASRVRAGRLAGYDVGRRFYEIGSTQGIADTTAYLKGRP